MPELPPVPFDESRRVKLSLNLKGEYFDAIKSGEKTEEFRLITPYWKRRIENKQFSGIVLMRGYPKSADETRRMELPWRGYRVTEIQHPHFGAKPVQVFAIKVAA